MAAPVTVVRTSLHGDDWTVTGVLPSVWQLRQPEPFDPVGFDPPAPLKVCGEMHRPALPSRPLRRRRILGLDGS